MEQAMYNYYCAEACLSQHVLSVCSSNLQLILLLHIFRWVVLVVGWLVWWWSAVNFLFVSSMFQGAVALFCESIRGQVSFGWFVCCNGEHDFVVSNIVVVRGEAQQDGSLHVLYLGCAHVSYVPMLCRGCRWCKI